MHTQNACKFLLCNNINEYSCKSIQINLTSGSLKLIDRQPLMYQCLRNTYHSVALIHLSIPAYNVNVRMSYVYVLFIPIIGGYHSKLLMYST